MAEEADDVHWKMDAVMLVRIIFCLFVRAEITKKTQKNKCG